MIDKKTRNLVLRYFYQKIPNALLPDHIANSLGLKIETVKEVVDGLEKEGLIIKGAVSPKLPSRISYNLKVGSKDYPIEEHIMIGNYAIPRMLDEDVARAEDVNQAIEFLHKFTGELENKFQVKLDNQLKSFYGNLIAIFGIFIAIFALIMTAVKTSESIPMPIGIISALKISFVIYVPLFVSLLLVLVLIYIVNKTILKSK